MLYFEVWITIWFDHPKAIHPDILLFSSLQLCFNLFWNFKVDTVIVLLLLWPWLKCCAKKNMRASLMVSHRCLGVSSFLLLYLDMAYQLRPVPYRKVCFYSTNWSRGKEGQNRLLRAKLNLCRAAGSHEIKPLTLSAVFIIRWPFLCVLCCDFDVLSHNRGATILWRGCQ